MKKENNKYLIIFIVIIGLVFLINGGKKEAGTTVSINLDTMTVDNEAIQNTDCDNENEYVTLMDSEEIDVRSVFVGGFPNDYNNIIPSGKTITSATWEFKTRDVFYDDGTERDYSKVKCYVSGSRDSNDCDSCMSFDDSFEDCNIDNGDQLIKNGKLYDSTWYSIDVTATFKYAYENNKFFAIWCKGDTSDSDDLTLTEVWGSNAGTSAPFIDVTYDSGNGGTGCSETDNGIIINGS